MHRTLALITALLMLFAAGCTDRYKTKEELFKEGVMVLNANNPGGAILSFKKALEKDQNFFEARLQLAKAYLGVGKIDSAENELQKVVRQSPASRDVHIELGKVWLLKSRPDDAIREVSGYLDGPAGDAEAVEIAGWAHAMKGEYPQSISLLKRILADKDHGARAALTLSRVYVKMGRYNDAKARVMALLAKDPQDAGALIILGDVQTRTNDIDGALATYDRFIGIVPGNIDVPTKKTLLLIARGSYDQADVSSEAIVTAFPSKPEGYMLKGIASYYKRNYVEASAQLEKSVSLGQIPGAYYFLGLTHYAKGEPEQAITDLKRATNLSPSYSDAGILTSTILLKKNLPDEAVREIKKVLEKDEKNAVAHAVLGSAYIAGGSYEEGISEIDRAIEIDPRVARFQTQKGLIELNAGRFREAEVALKAAVDVEPELLQSRVALASYYSGRGEYDKAVATLQQGIKGKKTDAVYYDLIAGALSSQNRQAEAVRYLEKAKQCDPADGMAYFKLASLYIQGGDTDSATRELQSFIARAPGDPRAYLTIAGILDSKGDKKGALDYYIKARATGKADGCNGLARYYIKENRPDEALAVAAETAKAFPQDPVSRELRGAVLLQKKKYADALDVFEDAERLRPGFGLPLIINTYVTMGKPEKAIDRIDKELVRAPDRLDLMAEKSRVYMNMGKKREAFDNAGRIVSMKPGSSAGYATLVWLHRRDGRMDKAIEVLRRPEAGKDIGLVMLLGSLYASRKDYAQAIEQYRKAEGMKPGYVPAVYQCANTLDQAGRKREARAEYLRVLQLFSSHLGAMNNLAYLYAEEDLNLADALQLARRAAALAPRNGQVQDTLGFVLLKNKKTDEGLKTLRRAAELEPGNPSIHYHLALAHRELGNRALAVDSLQKALGLGEFPQSAQARALLGKLKGGARG